MATRREEARSFKEGESSIVPVLLRESVLDSVSFRATTKHFEDQVDAVDTWLTGFVKHTHDFSHQFTRLEDVALNIHGKAVPTFIESGIIDPDFTVTAMARCSDANRAYWKSVFNQVRSMERTLTEPLVKLQHNELKEIRHLINEFHKQQKAYDEMLRYYHQQPKTKEASSLREDAFQLYEKRKAYIKASFDYTIKMSTFRCALDSAMIAAFSSSFESAASHTSAIATDFASRPSMAHIAAWSVEMKNSSRSAEEHLYSLRFDMEDEINRLVSPPRDLNEYAISPSKRISKVSSPININRPVKQNWLMMRTVTGKPARYVWHRKWCYVKGGIFGWLSNNHKTGAVEESDKYGVLLCNVRIPSAEDRRFCFEILTKDSIILLQAETDAEVADWLNAFELSKKAVIASTDSNEHAFAVRKPANEFAASPMTLESGHGEHVSEIMNLTPKKGHGKQDSGNHGLNAFISASVIASTLAAPRAGGLLGRVEDQKYYNPFESTTDTNALGPTTFAPAPMNTHLTKESLLDMSSSVIHAPSGTQANHWGSINYGLLNNYSSATLEKGTSKLLAAPEAIVDAVYLARDKDMMEKGIWDIAKHYPNEYPDELKRQDAQFSSIFPHARSEHVLMVIRGTRQMQGHKGSFSGRAYLTLRGFYFYAQACGMVLVQSCLYSEILSIRVERHVSFSELIVDIHDIGEARMALYLDDADLVRKRLELLLSNYIADEPQGTHAMLLLLQTTLPDDTKVIRSRKAPTRYESSEDEDNEGSKLPPKLDAVRIKLPSGPVLTEPDEQGLGKVYDAEFMITAKGLFHLLYGNRSPVFLTFYRDFRNHNDVQQLPWQTVEDGSLARGFTYLTGLEGSTETFRKQDYQRVVKRVEHIDYVVTSYVRPWHLPNGANYLMHFKSNVSFVSKTKSRLRIWIHMDWHDQSVWTRGIIAQAALETMLPGLGTITHVIESELLNRLGLGSKTSKAVRIYGRVGGASEPMMIETTKTNYVPQLKQYRMIDLIQRYPMVFLTSIIKELYTIASELFKAIRGAITANLTITFLLLLSLFVNTYLSSMTASTYWEHKSATKLLRRIQKSPMGLVSRHITLAEIEAIAHNHTAIDPDMTSGSCLEAFKSSQGEGGSGNIYYPAFQTTRNKISQSRNNLLIAMKVLNGIETEIVKGEWLSFVSKEQKHCDDINSLQLDGPGQQVFSESVRNHCDDCLRYPKI